MGRRACATFWSAPEPAIWDTTSADSLIHQMPDVIRSKRGADEIGGDPGLVLATVASASMNTPPRLGYTILISDELAALRHFYAEVLGLEVIEERPDYVKLDAGSIFVALRCPNRPYDHPAAGGSVQLAFPTNEVDQWAERLRLAGVEILEPPTDQPWVLGSERMTS